MEAGLKEALLWAGAQGWEPELLHPQPGSAPQRPVCPRAGPVCSLGLHFAVRVAGLAGCLLPGGTVCGDMSVGNVCIEAKARRKTSPQGFFVFPWCPGVREVEIPGENICGLWPSILGLATFESRRAVSFPAVPRTSTKR